MKEFFKELFIKKSQIYKENKIEEKFENLGEEVDYDKLISLVFSEIVFNEKRNYIDYDEFSHVLWTTNIDKTCCIDFIDH